jgi:WD repeat-containing protein 6
VNGLFCFKNGEQIFLFIFSQTNLQMLCFEQTRLLERTQIMLPTDFWIVCLEYLPEDQILLCGSRKGSLIAYDLHQDIKRPLLIVYSLHQADAVTSIKSKYISANKLEIKTVGRDGMYTISVLQRKSHHFDNPDSSFEFETTHRTRITKGWLEKVIEVDGTTFLLGFFDKNFFIYNETKGYKMFAVGCGGGHRFWDIIISNSSLDDTIFAFHRLRNVYYCRKQYSQKICADPVVLEPYHSLETKCVDFLRLNETHNIIVSGGEDGILSFHLSNPGSALKRLSFFRKHSGSIRAISCPPGSTIFTGGAVQELKAWKVIPQNHNLLSCVEIAAAPSVSELVENRVMDLDTVVITDGYLMVTANSDSSVQLWMFRNVFQLLCKSDYHNKCVLKAKFLRCDNLLYSFTAGTDGRICMWDVTDHKLNLAHEFRAHQSGVKALHVCLDESIYILSGGDDNALSLYKLNPISLKYDKWVVDNAHSSSIVGVWMNTNKQIYSVSADQRLNTYQLTDEGIKFRNSTFVEIADCSDMVINSQIAIVGHGIQVFKQQQLL